MFHHLIVAVLTNTQKEALFSVEERKRMIRESTAEFANVEVDSFDGLLVEYAGRREANVILRGIRAIADYETELQMASLNHHMRPLIETVFLLSHEAHSFISSRMIKEIVTLGGDVSKFVPPAAVNSLKQKFDNREE